MNTCNNCGSAITNEKYCTPACMGEYKRKERNRRVEENGAARSAREARLYLLDTRRHACEICATETWNDRPIPLICDHVNGNPEDHRVENLRLICPNCDALLPTYKGKNMGSGRASRRKRYADGKSY